MNYDDAAGARVPTLLLSDGSSADVALLLDGVELPPPIVLGAVAAASSTDLGCDVAPAPTGGRSIVLVRLSAQLVASAVQATALDLLDREGTPVARVIEVVQAAEDLVQGALIAGQPREAQSFANLRATPAEVPRSAVAVVVGRPILREDLDRIQRIACGATVTVLLPAEGPSPDGVPTSILHRAVHAALALDLPHARLIAVPLAWRGKNDIKLAKAVGRAYGARTIILAPYDPPWSPFRTALAAGQEFPPGLAHEAGQALRQWRPPRGRRGLVVLLSGLSGSGKSTLARGLVERLEGCAERSISLFDGDEVRRVMSADLGFDRASREANLQRIGWVAAQVAKHGGLAICAVIAPYASTRAQMRAMALEVGDFVLVHVATPLDTCERRDFKGLYAKARTGALPEFTGVSDLYEVPDDADIVVDTAVDSRGTILDAVVSFLVEGGWISKSVQN